MDGCQKLAFADVGRFPVFMLRPMRNEGNRLVVDIADYWFSYRPAFLFFRRAMFKWELEGGTSVYFRYDPAGDRFVVEQVKLSGI